MDNLISRKMAVLGPERSNSEAAAFVYSKDNDLNPTLVYKSSIKDVVKALIAGEVEESVVPVSNPYTETGTVAGALLAIFTNPVKIKYEMALEIRYVLATASDAPITKIKSKPEAVDQCSYCLESEFPNAEIVGAKSTSAAASEHAEKRTPGEAVIVPPEAAERYKLKALKGDIQNPDNATTFAILAKKNSHKDILIGGDMRTAIFVELEEDEPRQLENILRSFGKRKINLTDINRLRYRNHNVFHVECEGQEDSPAVAEALDEIKDSRWGIMKIAGSYPFKKFRNPNNQNNSK